MNGYKPVTKWKMTAVHDCAATQPLSGMTLFTLKLQPAGLPVMAGTTTTGTYDACFFPVFFEL
jgi:hypothetical protein